jgi:hypothetical protein
MLKHSLEGGSSLNRHRNRDNEMGRQPGGVLIGGAP